MILGMAMSTGANCGFALVFALLFQSIASGADDDSTDPLTDAGRTALQKRFDEGIERLALQIKDSPKSTDAYSRRGDLLFFRGKFADSVADFEKMVELQPDLETSHWRRGIAYFYAGRYKDAAKQFEIYHTFDDVDRENGIWRFLSQAKAYDLKKAREGLLKYKKDDREPFPDVYRMFAGDLTGEEVLGRIDAAKVSPEEKDKRLFYAQLYVGLYAAVNDKSELAEKHLREATKNKWGEKAGGGPGWMWQVGRVHHDLLVAERMKKAKSKAE